MMDELLSELPGWALFLVAAIWALAKGVASTIQARRTAKVRKIKREFEKRSLPPPPPDLAARADDTGRIVLQELEAERQDRARLEAIHESLKAAAARARESDQWQGQMLSSEAQHSRAITALSSNVATLTKSVGRRAEFDAALLDGQAQTNELLRGFVKSLGGEVPPTRKSKASTAATVPMRPVRGKDPRR